MLSHPLVQRGDWRLAATGYGLLWQLMSSGMSLLPVYSCGNGYRVMLNIRKLTKSVGGRTLFADADFTVNYADRVALVGPNGAGKSTLFNVILGEDPADSGAINRDEWTTLGFLPPRLTRWDFWPLKR